MIPEVDASPLKQGASHRWLTLLRPGDWIVAGAAAVLVALSYPLLWQGGAAKAAEIRRDGEVIARFPLNGRRLFAVDGPLGKTVIEIAPGRARVLSDPGPRQYCVAQGWLARPRAIAICAPNRVTLSITGDSDHDSIHY